ncbi:nitrate/nitrite transporter [Kutzneria buriramensis]|uniref:Putative MFS family arabinose efflux permease n=1 Tax=Kutzneria buriramensis TaxID=1045776 RepID=A0A3E0GUB2_9PSEU|nr:MFS transporter [Kutzneria buriramensis]REH27658.1 putative MFS family arabinose efflux permease [Kutzneria buriramensis]
MSSTPDTAALRRPLPRTVATRGLILMAVSFLINAMDRQVFYPLLPEISGTYHFSLSQGGLLATGFTLGVAVAGLPAGHLVDRLPRKTVLVVSILIYSLGTILTPLASGFADLAVYRLLSGLGEGMQAAALYAAFGAYFHQRRSLAFGVLGVAFGVGVLIGPIIGTGLAQALATWRAPFYLFGALGVLVALLILATVHKGLTESSAAMGTATPADLSPMPAGPYNRNTMLLALAAIGGGLAFYGFLGLYPTYLRTVLHFTAGQTAVATSLVGAGAALSLPTGWLGDRIDPRKLLLVTYAGVAVSAYILFNGPDTPAWHYVFSFVLAGFLAGSMFTNVNSTMNRSVRPAQSGRAAGLFVATYYAAAAVSGLIFAQLVAAIGWHGAALWQLTVLPAVMVVPLWFLDSRRILGAPHNRRESA